jgi:hypothetical protein
VINKSVCIWLSVFEQSPHNWRVEVGHHRIHSECGPCYTEHGLREHRSACKWMSGDWRGTLWTLLVTFCIVVIRCTETFFITVYDIYHFLRNLCNIAPFFNQEVSRYGILTNCSYMVTISQPSPTAHCMNYIPHWNILRCDFSHAETVKCNSIKFKKQGRTMERASRVVARGASTELSME